VTWSLLARSDEIDPKRRWLELAGIAVPREAIENIGGGVGWQKATVFGNQQHSARVIFSAAKEQNVLPRKLLLRRKRKRLAIKSTSPA